MFSLINNIKKNNKNISRGFTLVELLVTLSIFAITTGVVMISQGKFDNSILLTNTAYDIAITIRQAQTYGVNVIETDLGAGGFNFPYGVAFSLVSGSGNPKKFNLFVDTTVPSNYKMDDFDCDNDECLNTYKIMRGHYIKEIITTESDNSTSTAESLDITFKRPNPDAIILAGGDSYSVANLKRRAEIVLSSADGSAKRSVIITKAGQIYVDK